MLTAGELQNMRETAQGAMPDTATIYRKTTTNEGGEEVEDWSVLTETACRIAPLTDARGAGETGIVGDRVAEETSHVVTLPAETDIEEADLIAIDDVPYQILLVRKRGAWEVTRRIEVKESVQPIPEIDDGSGGGEGSGSGS